ncbi:MAG: host specificity protein J [Methanocella sp.]
MLDLDAKRKTEVKPSDPITTIIAPILSSLAAWGTIKWAWVAVQVALQLVYSWFVDQNRPKQDKPTYGWEAGSNTVGVGRPVPLIYGTHKAFGHILQSYISTSDDTQWAHMLLGVSEGSIEAIREIKIDDQLVRHTLLNTDNYQDCYFTKGTVYANGRTGTATQGKIPWFGETRNTYAVNLRMDDGTEHVYPTAASDVDDFEIVLSFPQGLYHMESDGDVKNNGLGIAIDCRKDGGAWLGEKTFRIESNKRTNFFKTKRATELWGDPEQDPDSPFRTPGRYDIRVRTMSRSEYNSTYTVRKLEWKTVCTGTGQNRECSDVQVWNEYQPSCYRDEAYDAWMPVFASVTETTSKATAYPNTALVAVKVKATNLMSGGLPTVSCVVDGIKVRTRVNGSWTAPAFTRNPAWIVYDLLTNARYGLGSYISEEDVDLASFEAFAAYCDELVSVFEEDGVTVHHVEPRCTCNIVIDQAEPAFDIIHKVLAPSRGLLVEADGKYRIVIEKPEPMTQIFTMGNIVKDSLRTHWMNLKEEYNTIEALYLDESKDWERGSARYSTSLDPKQLPAKPKVMQTELPGVTRYSQAKREANFRLNLLTRLSQSVEFDVALDAITCCVGDVIGVAHDVPQWGYSGRVAELVPGTPNVLTMDRTDLPFEAGKTYEVVLRFPNDEIHFYDVQSVSSKTVTVNSACKCHAQPMPSLGDSPARDAVYSYGEVNKSIKQFRVSSLTLNDDLTRHISAYEYSPDVYEETRVCLNELPSLSALPNPLAIGPVRELRAEQHERVTTDNRTQFFADISWLPPDSTDGVYSHGKVWYRVAGQASWSYAGDGYDSFMLPLKPGEYHVAVTSVAASGVQQDVGQVSYVYFTITGKTGLPGKATGVLATGEPGAIAVSWSAPNTPDTAGYRVYMGTSPTFSYSLDTPNWEGNALNCTLPVPGGVTRYFKVHAMDSYKQLSEPSDGTASATAKNIVFRQAEQPTASGVGDLWIDTDNGNRLWYWDGTAWQDAQDLSVDRSQPTSLATVTATISNESLYQDGLGNWWVRLTVDLGNIPEDGRRAYIQVKHKTQAAADYTLDEQVAVVSGSATVTLDSLVPSTNYFFGFAPVTHYGVSGTGREIAYETAKDQSIPGVPVMTIAPLQSGISVLLDKAVENDWDRNEVVVLASNLSADDWGVDYEGAVAPDWLTVHSTAHDGAVSQEVKLTTSTGVGFAYVHQTQPCSAGQTAVLTAQAKGTRGGSGSGRMRLKFLNDADVSMGEYAALFVPTANFSPQSISYTAPAETTKVRVEMGCYASSGGDTADICFDSASLSIAGGANVLANPSFETVGGLTGWVTKAAGRSAKFDILDGIMTNYTYWVKARRFDTSNNFSDYCVEQSVTPSGIEQITDDGRKIILGSWGLVTIDPSNPSDSRQFVNRMLMGMGSNGDWVPLNWTGTPKVLVSPRSVRTYRKYGGGTPPPDYSPHNQRLECYADGISPAGFRLNCKVWAEGTQPMHDISDVTVRNPGNEWASTDSSSTCVQLRIGGSNYHWMQLCAFTGATQRIYYKLYWRRISAPTTSWQLAGEFHTEYGHYNGSFFWGYPSAWKDWSHTIDGLDTGTYQVRVVFDHISQDRGWNDGNPYVVVKWWAERNETAIDSGDVNWIAMEGGD